MSDGVPVYDAPQKRHSSRFRHFPCASPVFAVDHSSACFKSSFTGFQLGPAVPSEVSSSMKDM